MSKSKSPASAPVTDEGLQYHLHTKKGDIAPYCLLVGDPDRATLIAKEFFTEPRLVGDHRGLKSYTGFYSTSYKGSCDMSACKDIPVSVVTTGMGSASLGIVVPEAYESGARMFIRVGTCGALIKKAQLGDLIIVSRALRLEGASKNWAPDNFLAVADERAKDALVFAAMQFYPQLSWVGIEATTDCFREGQGRPSPDTGEVSEIARKTHEYVLEQGATCYSMEASALFVWCATHYGKIPCGVVNAVIGNRITNEWGVKGEKEAAHVALEAICLLAK